MLLELLCFVAIIMCSAPTIFHSVRTNLELCKVFFVFCKNTFCFIGIILDMFELFSIL